MQIPFQGFTCGRRWVHGGQSDFWAVVDAQSMSDFVGQGVKKIVCIGASIGGPSMVGRVDGQIETNDFALGVGPNVGEGQQ